MSSLAVAVEGVLGLLGAGDNGRDGDGDGVDGGAESEAELLAGAKGGGVPDVGGGKVGEDAEDALLFFEVHLVFGEVVLGVGDLDAGDGGGDLQFDSGNFVDLTRLEREIAAGPGFKALGGNEEGEAAGFDAVEFEGAGGVGGDGAVDAGRGVFEGDGGVGDVGAVGVLDDAGDRAAWGWRVKGLEWRLRECRMPGRARADCAGRSAERSGSGGPKSASLS